VTRRASASCPGESSLSRQDLPFGLYGLRAGFAAGWARQPERCGGQWMAVARPRRPRPERWLMASRRASGAFPLPACALDHASPSRMATRKSLPRVISVYLPVAKSGGCVRGATFRSAVRRNMIAAVSGGFECEFDQGSGEALLPGVGFGEIGLEAIAEGHQFIDFGDDAVLFGERLPCSRIPGLVRIASRSGDAGGDDSTAFSVISPTSGSGTTASNRPSSSAATSSWCAPTAPDGKLTDYEISLHLRRLSAAAVPDPFPGGRYQMLPIAWDARPKGRRAALVPPLSKAEGRPSRPAALDRRLPQLGAAVRRVPFDQSAQGLRSGQPHLPNHLQRNQRRLRSLPRPGFGACRVGRQARPPYTRRRATRAAVAEDALERGVEIPRRRRPVRRARSAGRPCRNEQLRGLPRPPLDAERRRARPARRSKTAIAWRC
jgi:hypothetical protein